MTRPTTGPGLGAETHDADALLVQGRPRPSARVPLDRERIVTAAIDHIDELGLAGLSMRHLGGRLGVEAMALYRYVSGKDQLLDAVVERLLEAVDNDPEVLTAPTHGWEDFVQRLAHGLRRVALSHPAAFPLVASRPTAAPWLRPPLRSVTWVEHFLRALHDEDFDDEALIPAYRAFTSFLLGHLLLEVAALGADLGPLDVIEKSSDDPAALEGFPTVDRLQGPLSEDHSAVEFEAALEELLERMQLMRLHPETR